jgi:hypothetical protein
VDEGTHPAQMHVAVAFGNCQILWQHSCQRPAYAGQQRPAVEARVFDLSLSLPYARRRSNLRLRLFARHLAEAAFSTPWTHGASTHSHLEGGVTTWAHFPRESLLAFPGAPRTAVPRREGLQRMRRGLVAMYQQLRGTTVPTHCARSQGAAAPFRTLSQASLQSRCKVHPIHRPCMTNSGHEPLLNVHGQKVSDALLNREA